MINVQLPACMQFFNTPSRHKALHSGRGASKSHTAAAMALIRGAQRPERIVCCREIQKSIKESTKRLLEDKIKVLGLSDFYRSTESEIKAPNGTLINFFGLGSNPDGIQSAEGYTLAIVEEAHRISQRSINILMPTIRAPNSELWWMWNRNSTTDPVDDMFLGPDGPPPRSIVRQISWRDNPWFPEVLREQMEWDKSRDMDKYLHIWEGEPLTRSAARVFKNWVVEDIDDQVPEGLEPRFGADWGFSNDPTVLIKCFVWGRTLYFREEAYKIGCDIDDTPGLFGGTDTWEKPRWTNRRGFPGIKDSWKYPIVADSARPETISYMRKHGFPRMVKSRKGAGSVEEGIAFMQSYDIVIHPSCTHTIDEFTHYSYKTDPKTEEVMSVLVDKKNHVIDSGRYLLEGVRRPGRKISVHAPEIVTA